MKKLMVSAVLLTLLTSLAAAPVGAAWQKEGSGNWSYLQQNGQKATGWLQMVLYESKRRHENGLGQSWRLVVLHGPVWSHADGLCPRRDELVFSGRFRRIGAKRHRSLRKLRSFFLQWKKHPLKGRSHLCGRYPCHQ